MMNTRLFDFHNLKNNINKHRKIYDDYKSNIKRNENKRGLFEQNTLTIDEYVIGCAFLYHVEKDEAWAKKCQRIIKSELLDKDYFQNKKGLNLYFKNYYMSICYDLCKNSGPWKRIKESVSKEIYKLSEFCFYNGGSQQNQAPSSNWKALRFSMAGIGYIATDEEDLNKDSKIFGCFLKCRKYIQSNFGGGFGGIEGDGYTRYAWSGLGPFGIALEKNYGWLIDDSANFDVEYQFMWELISIVPIYYKQKDGTEYKGISPDFATDNPNCGDSKFMGLAWYYLDEQHLSGLKNIFDTFYKDGKYYAKHDSGIIHLLSHLNYEIESKPTLKEPDWIIALDEPKDGNGYHTYRNRVQDENDIICQIHTCSRKHSGHMGPDKSNFRIVGNDTIWAIGGGWYMLKDENGVPYNNRHANTIFPGGYGGPHAEKLHMPFGKTCGKLIKSHVYSNEFGVSGYTMSCAGPQNHFDTEGMKRRFFVNFDTEGVEASIVVADTSLNGRYWQMSTFFENDIKVISENQILLTNPTNTHSMLMTILYPTKDFEIKTYEVRRGGICLYKDRVITSNKNIVIERKDPVPGMTDEMKLPEKRGMRNSLLYHRDESGGLWKPKYEEHEGNFIVVMTICNNNQNHPNVTYENNIININNRNIKCKFNEG